MTSKRLEGQTIVITGAGRGIGRAIATRFAAEGAAVVLGARTRDEVDACAEAIRAAGGEASATTLDVTSQESVDALAELVHDRHGSCPAWSSAAPATSSPSPRPPGSTARRSRPRTTAPSTPWSG